MFASVVGFQPFGCAVGREWEFSSRFDQIAQPSLRFDCVTAYFTFFTTRETERWSAFEDVLYE